jgi:hypothetical protein
MSRIDEIRKEVKMIRKAAKVERGDNYCFCKHEFEICSWCTIRNLLLLLEETLNIIDSTMDSRERINVKIPNKAPKAKKEIEKYDHWF